MANITVPIVLDANATAQIFSEVTPSTDVSYVFTMDSNQLKAVDLEDFVKYIDDNSDNTLFAYSETAKQTVLTKLQKDICNQTITHDIGAGASFPNHASSVGSSTIGEMLVKYIASVLFGHPEAQAPIENDDTIKKSVQVDSSLAEQFVDELSAGLEDNYDESGNDTVPKENYVLQSIFEQLISYSSETDASGGTSPDSNRFGDKDDTGVYHGIPFRDDDTITFLISMTGNITQDSTDYTGQLDNQFTVEGDTDLANLFESNPELNGLNLNPKIWEVRLTLKGGPAVV